MTHFYLYRADLLKGWPRVWKSSATALEERTRNQVREVVEYVADYLPERLIIDNTGEIRIPTEQEKYNLDPANYTPPQGYFVKDELVRSIPAVSAGMLNPKFDEDSEQWIETASQEQLDARAASIKKWAYLDELHRYGYARSEHALGLVSDSDMAAADAYMQALAAEDETAIRPEWFCRYEA